MRLLVLFSLIGTIVHGQGFGIESYPPRFPGPPKRPMGFREVLTIVYGRGSVGPTVTTQIDRPPVPYACTVPLRGVGDQHCSLRTQWQNQYRKGNMSGKLVSFRDERTSAHSSANHQQPLQRQRPGHEGFGSENAIVISLYRPQTSDQKAAPQLLLHNYYYYRPPVKQTLTTVYTPQGTRTLRIWFDTISMKGKRIGSDWNPHSKYRPMGDVLLNLERQAMRLKGYFVGHPNSVTDDFELGSDLSLNDDNYFVKRESVKRGSLGSHLRPTVLENWNKKVWSGDWNDEMKDYIRVANFERDLLENLNYGGI